MFIFFGIALRKLFYDFLFTVLGECPLFPCELIFDEDDIKSIFPPAGKVAFENIVEKPVSVDSVAIG